MKLIIKLTTMLLFISITACGDQDKQTKASDPVVLKTQLEDLDKAKQVERMLQDAAVQQRKTVDESTHSQGQ
jgi:predicted small lipoprotein YifL